MNHKGGNAAITFEPQVWERAEKAVQYDIVVEDWE